MRHHRHIPPEFLALGIELRGAFQSVYSRTARGLRRGLQAGQRPQLIREFVALGEAAVGKTDRKQSVLAGRRALGAALVAHRFQELGRVTDPRREFAEVGPILAQLALPDSGEHRDCGVLVMFGPASGVECATP